MVRPLATMLFFVLSTIYTSPPQVFHRVFRENFSILLFCAFRLRRNAQKKKKVSGVTPPDPPAGAALHRRSLKPGRTLIPTLFVPPAAAREKKRRNWGIPPTPHQGDEVPLDPLTVTLMLFGPLTESFRRRQWLRQRAVSRSVHVDYVQSLERRA